MSLLDYALDYHHNGLAVVPAATDGTKRPAINWKSYTSSRPTEEQLIEWFTDHTYDGLGLICGAVSGHLEMLEIEGRAIELVPQLAQLLAENGLSGLWLRLTTGYLEESPSGGMHWLYKVDGADARPNTKLARRPSTNNELAAHQHRESEKAIATLTGDHLAARLYRIDELTPAQVPQVLIETRGEGGFTVAAPSGGRTHPTGKTWRRLAGSPTTIPVITGEERDALHAIANMLDTMPTPDVEPHFPDQAPVHQVDPLGLNEPWAGGTIEGGVRPGDDYNARTIWDDILIPLGWTKTRTFGRDRQGWTRPGKETRDGISATTGGAADGVDRLYVFSSSTEFEAEKPYDKFAAYCLLEHRGDFAAAASALAKAGYGTRPPAVERPPEPSRPVNYQANAATAAEQTDGNLAAVLAMPAPEERHLKAVEESTLERSDDGNALLLIDRFGDRIRFIAERGRWIAWNGARWEWCPSGGGVVREYAKRVARALPTASTAATTHKKKSLSANGCSAMITQAETDERITTSYKKLDSHAYELNTPDGTINLLTGELTPPNPTRLHTRSATVTPDADLPTPLWLQFLADTFEGSPEVLPFVQRLAGYSASGVVSHHVLPFLHGPGGNGKSVFLDVLRVLLGDYAGSAPAKFLMAAQPQHETEIARLAGLRMVICSEVNQNDKFDEAKVKLLTGGDALTARFMRQDHFTFEPNHHLWLMGNHQPKVAGGGESFWRRLRIVSFANIVADEKKDERLVQRLISEEGPGILAWIVAGAQTALTTGLAAPKSVMAATDTYASEEDVLARFITDRCMVGGGTHTRTATADLRAAYTRWCTEEGEQPLNPQVFGRELRTRYDIEQTRSNGKRYYLGITLHADEPDADDPRSQSWYD